MRILCFVQSAANQQRDSRKGCGVVPVWPAPPAARSSEQCAPPFVSEPASRTRARGKKEIRTKGLIFRETESKKQVVTGWRSWDRRRCSGISGLRANGASLYGLTICSDHGPTIRGAPEAQFARRSPFLP